MLYVGTKLKRRGMGGEVPLCTKAEKQLVNTEKKEGEKKSKVDTEVKCGDGGPRGGEQHTQG